MNIKVVNPSYLNTHMIFDKARGKLEVELLLLQSGEWGYFRLSSQFVFIVKFSVFLSRLTFILNESSLTFIPSFLTSSPYHISSPSLQMDGATTASTGSNNSAPGGTSNNGAASFLNLGNLGSNSAVAGGMGLFSSGEGGGGDSGLGGFGTSLGNGFSNDGTSMGGGGGGGGSGNPSFDLNDFPSLGGGAGGVVGGAAVTAENDNGLAAALRQQQQILHQQMVQNQINPADKSSNLYRLAMSSGIANGAANNFSMTTEDFPALGGSGAVGGIKSDGTLSSTASNGILDSSGGGQLDYTGLIGSTGVTATSTSQTRTTPSGGSSIGSSGNSGSGGAIGGDYGLVGLLPLIRMTDADRNRLALGENLTVLGLNLNSPDNLHSTFGGPFTDKPTTKEPHYQVRQYNCFLLRKNICFCTEANPHTTL